jgi:hypothetical protein
VAAQLAEEPSVGRPIPSQVYGISESREVDEVYVPVAEDLEVDPVLAESCKLGLWDLRHSQILPN